MTNTPSEDRLDRIERLTESNSQAIQQLTADLAGLATQVNELRAESKKWDERFFQLSRDTLIFSRNVIITAAVVAVLTPALQVAVIALVEAFRGNSAN
jgi:cytochrome c biogenesis factor